jgi:hypothetical protein
MCQHRKQLTKGIFLLYTNHSNSRPLTLLTFFILTIMIMICNSIFCMYTMQLLLIYFYNESFRCAGDVEEEDPSLFVL